MPGARLWSASVTLTLLGSTALSTLMGPASAVPSSAPAAPSAATSTAIYLSTPSGPFRTGTALVHLRDRGRIDPLDPRHRPRELMAQIWYPAKAAPGRPLAPYAPAKEAAALQKFYPVPAGAFTATTHSRLRAPVLGKDHRVVFFYHGLCASRTDTTVIDEQLASEGFVVVALASTHESLAVEFPGGRVETTSDPDYCLAGDPSTAKNRKILGALLRVRVADTRFVLDQLDRINRDVNPDVDGTPLPAGAAGSMDTARVGVFGHSFGGSTTANVMVADHRFVAGVNLDGFVNGAAEYTGTDRPFLVLGSSYHNPDFDPTWAQFLPRLTGWHRWFELRQAGHYRFIDLGGSARRWGLQSLKRTDPQTWREVFGDIGDRISQQVVTRTTAAFFEHFLQGRPEPLLNRPGDYYRQLWNRTGSIRPHPAPRGRPAGGGHWRRQGRLARPASDRRIPPAGAVGLRHRGGPGPDRQVGRR